MYRKIIPHLMQFLDYDSDGIYNIKDGIVMLYDDRRIINLDTNDGYLWIPAGRDDVCSVDLTEDVVKDIRVFQEVKFTS